MTMHTGSCHCGNITFEADVDLEKTLKCNCSLCRRRSAVMTPAQNDSFRLTSGADQLREYQFHTGTARHYFCGHCGVYTHHNPRRDPSMTVVNTGCLEGVDPYSLNPRLNDGQSFD